MNRSSSKVKSAFVRDVKRMVGRRLQITESNKAARYCRSCPDVGLWTRMDVVRSGYLG